MSKRHIKPNTTLFPVPVVLVTAGDGDDANVATINRISSCNAEPPMIAISVRPGRHTHTLIEQTGEFVVNIPAPGMDALTDYVGVTTGREEAKWEARGLTPTPASAVGAPLIAECPVHLECRVVEQVKLPSHSLFIAEVVAIQADEDALREDGEIDMGRVPGMIYASSAVRERPVEKVRVDELRERLTGGA